uniref:hypothetical protein n=1 Tax=uncultured Caulobacter sp. TaxID=158749 RepID=UPI0025FE7F01|nr:hypothetical protein [uncultured Caulobacter sp.]
MIRRTISVLLGIGVPLLALAGLRYIFSPAFVFGHGNGYDIGLAAILVVALAVSVWSASR